MGNNIKKLSLTIVLLMYVSLFFQGFAQKPYLSDNNPNEISNIGYLKPFSFIQLIEEGNKGSFNDSISQSAQDTMLSVIEELKDKLPFNQYVEITGPTAMVRLQKELEQVISRALVKQKIPAPIPLPKTIDSIFTSRNIRFGLLTVTTGFTRVKGNLGKQVGKGIATGILTLGMYSQSPVKAGSTIHAVLVDTEKDTIAFYNHSSYNSEPLNKKMLSKQFSLLFEKYFNLKKS